MTAFAPPAGAACANEIACENAKPGTPKSVWDIQEAGDETIQGFATQISVNRGERIDFKVDTTAPSFSVEIYRTGWYAGDGARRIDTQPIPTVAQDQPNCANDVATDMVDCGSWAVSASWTVPPTAVSGVYIARLVRGDGVGDSHVTFIVRDDASHSDLVFQTSDTTWQAYNNYGGPNYYSGGSHGTPARAYKLSYNRPFNTRYQTTKRDFYFANEYPLVRFLERNGYDVSYIAGPDTDRRGHLLTNHKTYLSVGHDEYWSGRQRANVLAARDAGVNLMFLSGNEMYWRVRWEIDHRTMTSYKETWANGKADPEPEWTGTFRDPRFAPQSAGAGIPENAVTGTMFMANHNEFPLKVDSREGRLRLWRNTDLAALPPGGSRELTPRTVGYESDEDLDNGFRPPGLIRLSTTTGTTQERLQDFGNTVSPGQTTHHMTMYRAQSGALVFGAGTIQWTWGLDDVHDASFGAPPPDPAMQQAQVNLLADMDAQPTTLMAGLSPASASTDTVGPTVTIGPLGGQQANGARVTVSGTAQDVGGGQVAGVEVSTDRGATWHPAEGTTSWSYTYTQHGYGARAVRVRAVDDSANIGPGRARHPQATCPCSIFGDEVPAVPDSGDGSPYELGLRFIPMRDGAVTGVRFYKGAGNTGTHVGRLWTSGGTKLGEATFTSESATGWQSVSFPAPVTVQAGQTYVVSYSAPNGHYAAELDAFELHGIEADPVSVPGGFAGGDAGVFSGTPGAFPQTVVRNSNYYVDVRFQPSGPPDPLPTIEVTGRQPAPGSTGVPRTTAVTVSFSAPIDPGAAFTVSQGSAPVAGSVTTSEGGRTLTFTPSAALAPQTQVTASLSGVTSTDGIDLAPLSWSFTTESATTTGPPTTDPPAHGTRTVTLFGSRKPRGKLSARRGVEVGVEFTPTRAGSVVALRYFQVSGRVAPRSVTLWSDRGTRLVRAKIPRKGAKPAKAGWRTVTLADPVGLRAGRSYVASYYLPAGRAARTTDFFKRKVWSSGPLRAKRSDNGRYVFAPKSRFPRKVDRGVNFYADVRFDY
ncbi:N,N-dimethylformamidase beta subunit family domain-containing protein [Nocardioides sp. LHG3406-4]|uniref:N,N-dimethylformamidase beta subunit family domain-containing protein n=1 Tax=Nocardioides sp. LHG3406-4 TaxID=2804575 RepID=UPI003CF43E25